MSGKPEVDVGVHNRLMRRLDEPEIRNLMAIAEQMYLNPKVGDEAMFAAGTELGRVLLRLTQDSFAEWVAVRGDHSRSLPETED